MPAPDPYKDDLRAAVGARRELGPEYEDAVIESFLEKLDHSIAAREVAAQPAPRPKPAPAESGPGRDPGMVLGIVSLGTGIPISAIAATEGRSGLLVAWGGIAAVNIAYAWARRRRP